ncbi:hypothetical protein NKH85_15715 [Mesorhizobium sp. M0924]|uniref:hypothetical protein n=1 Tax=unclassified Mesorhizobium TaxID=325217 RepID=UPI00333ACF94
MRRLITLAMLTVSNTAYAADAPGTVFVLNADDKSGITVICDPPVADVMNCHFTQMTVYKPDETQAETRIAKAADDMMKAPASEFGDCSKLAALTEGIESGKAPPDVPDKKGFEQNWIKEAPQAKADTIKLFKTMLAFCRSRDRKDAEALARASDELEGNTCKISNWTYLKTFSLNYSTKRWQSTVQNADSCGTIDYSEFSRPPELKDDYFWNYSAKTIVTNPNGKTLLGNACSETDQSDHQYVWQTGKFYANCRYIQVTP